MFLDVEKYIPLLFHDLKVPTPAKRDLSMVYLEAFRHSTIVVRVELLVGQGALSPDAVALEDPEATTGTSPGAARSGVGCCLWRRPRLSVLVRFRNRWSFRP